MKKSTINFILNLLRHELDEEYYCYNETQDTDYVKELISASKDFTVNFGNWTDEFSILEKIELLEKGN